MSQLRNNLDSSGRGFVSPRGLSHRWVLGLLVALLAVFALLPPLRLFLVGASSLQGSWGISGQQELVNTLQLLLGTGGFAAVLGTANGWLTARCEFGGRRWFRLAQLLPLATPSYLLAATWVDLGSRIGLSIYGPLWAILVLGLGTYSYVFLLSTESFASVSTRQLEVCRSLGVGPWGGFWRVALPMAAPAIGAGVALSGMEVVNEFGAVQLLGVPTLSAGVLQRWQVDGDLPGAVALAMAAMVVVMVLVWAERQLRQHSRRWNLGAAGPSAPDWPLDGWRQTLAQLITLLPPLASLGLPLLWIFLCLDQLESDSLFELFELFGRSLILAAVAALLAVLAALVLAISRRWISFSWLRALAFLSGLGYAIPGAVLALGLLYLGSPLGLAPLLLLVWGYVDRFLAVAKGGIDAALERLPPSVDEAATSLGYGWWGVLRRVHVPLLRSPLLVGALLVFVDTVKELPLTFALRPFDFDTLAVRVFQYASDERLGAAVLPALMILILGLVASLALVPVLEASPRD